MTPEADLSKVRTVPIAHRPNKVRAEEFAAPPGADRSFGAFLHSLPDVLAARDFRRVVDALVRAARQRAVVAMAGGHVVKTGIAPVLLELIRQRVITHIALNGSAAIHDYEVARWGGTSEDVAAGLRDGTFGMAEETGREMNEAIINGQHSGWGMGEALARALVIEPELLDRRERGKRVSGEVRVARCVEQVDAGRLAIDLRLEARHRDLHHRRRWRPRHPRLGAGARHHRARWADGIAQGHRRHSAGQCLWPLHRPMAPLPRRGHQAEHHRHVLQSQLPDAQRRAADHHELHREPGDRHGDGATVGRAHC
mgnify:CR=1 FL=1